MEQLQGLDHLAIAVPDTDEALRLWRDTLGLDIAVQETVNDGTVRLTHVDLGNTHLQLVEPLVADHPLQSWLDANGPGLHHLCFKVAGVEAAIKALGALGLPPASTSPHQGTQGKRAIFLDTAATQGVRVELTGA